MPPLPKTGVAADQSVLLAAPVERPVVLDGCGGSTSDSVRQDRCPRVAPFMNLVLCVLDRSGVEVERFGYSTSRLPDLTV